MKKITVIILLINLISCQNNKPKIVHNKNNIKMDSVKKELNINKADNSKIVDLPVHFENTKFLIHPIGYINFPKSKGRLAKFESGRYYSGSYTISKNNRFQISGNMSNIKFQSIDTETTYVLTDKNILIKSISLLNDYFKKTNTALFIYEVYDMDTNMDKIIDENDVETLYISNQNGSDFTKLTKNYFGLINWEVIIANNRLYFKSIEDHNNSGKFDKGDKFHTSYVNLKDKIKKPQKYIML